MNSDSEDLGTGPEVIKLFSCSTQLSMEFFRLKNVKILTIVGILTFMSKKNFMLSRVEHEKSFITSRPAHVRLHSAFTEC